MPDLLFQAGLLKSVLAFSLVLILTTLMGATLPIMAKYFVTENTHTGKQVDYLYSINTFGAAFPSNRKRKYHLGCHKFFCGFTALAYEMVWTRILVFSMAVRFILLALC